jgi:hypothetical protein
VTAVTVVYADPEPNGLAAMIGALIEGNLAAHPELVKRLTRPATYAIVAPDVDVAVSIRLAGGTVTVRNGVIGRPDVKVTTDSETLMGLSSVPLKFGLPDVMSKAGREVTRKLLQGKLKVSGLLLYPMKLGRLNTLLSVVEGS